MVATSFDPLWINQSASGTPSYTANEARTGMAVDLQYGGRNVGARQGVRPGYQTNVVTYANPTITVNPHLGVVDPGLSSTQGPYRYGLLTTDTHTANAAETNPRKDIVIMRIFDHDEDASGLRHAITQYIAGVAAPSPSEPAVPAGAMKLATLDVPNIAGGGLGSAVITQNYPFTVAAGGILPIRNTTEEAAITSPFAGMTTFRLDSGLFVVRNAANSAWRYVGEIFVCTSGTRPSAATEGLFIYETDTNRLLVWDGAAWVRMGNTGVGGRTGCRLRRNAVQSVPSGVTTSITWDTEDQDTDGFITVSSDTVTIPAGLGGIYAITLHAAGAVGGATAFLFIAPSSTITGMPVDFVAYVDPSTADRGAFGITIPLNAGDSFVCQVRHVTGANVNYTAWLSCYRIVN